MKLVVFKLNQLGDNVVFVPAMQALRLRFPGWHITLLTSPAGAELYGGPLGPQEVLVAPKHRFNTSYRRPWEMALWAWRVRGRRPDACLVSFDQGSAAHMVAKLSGAQVRVGARLEPPRVTGALTVAVAPPPDARPVSWNWEMAKEVARACGNNEAWPDESPPPDLSHLLTGGPRPRGGRRRIVVHSGASRSLNQWEPAHFAAAARSLSRDFEVVWIEHGGTTGAAPEGSVRAPVGSLGELACWLAGADLFLGNNSGPMHLANALGCPGVVVTGHAARGWDPYWHRGRWSVLRHPSLSCAPCDRISEELEGCANTATPMACLKFWTPEKVEAECRRRLERHEGSQP